MAVAVGNLLGIANDGGGFGAVAYGAWLATAGALLLLAGGRSSCPEDSRSRRWPSGTSGPARGGGGGRQPRRSSWPCVWYGLEVDEPTRFASFVATRRLRRRRRWPGSG